MVTVFGSTGTGKTKLSVELALAVAGCSDGRFGGYTGAEVISCDSMQIYQGLDIITNKATTDEMAGVEHHLIGFLDPAEKRGESYDVTQFVDDTNAIARRLKDVNRLPIVCGGTTYYLQHLLFPGRLITTTSSPSDGASGSVDLSGDPRWQQLGAEERELLSHVSAGNSAKIDLAAQAASDAGLAMRLWKLLQSVDPAMAARWHYRDTRKVANSLRVYKETGRPHSLWIAEQDQQKNSAADDAAEQTGVSRSRKLLFWLWCDPPILRKRLDDRVDEMVKRGLEAEVRHMRDLAKSMLRDEAAGSPNYQSGIFQTIGYRQFAEYLDRLDTLPSPASTKEGRECFDRAVEETKTATRQYAKSQLKWVQNKLIPEVRRAQQHAAANGGEVELYLLDATDVSQWDENVRQPALQVLSAFLNRQPLPHPGGVSNPAAATEYLYSGRTPNQALSKMGTATGTYEGQGEGARTIEANRLYTCDVCTFDPAHPVLVREVDKESHTRGRHHRNNAKRRMSADDKQKRINDKIAQGERVRALRQQLKEQPQQKPQDADGKPDEQQQD